MLENLCHSDSAFVTLTYAPEFMSEKMSLRPADLRNFLKRLRTSMAPQRLRFYACGEYGDRTERPHYHAILFGYATCLAQRSRYSKLHVNCCSQCDRIRDLWGLGNISLGTVTMESVGYTCAYVVKNMRRFDDNRLHGRHPEFARMSLKPGLGFDALWEVADVLMKYNLEDSDFGDVPRGLRHGRAVKPLGRYLRSRLREMVGKDAKAPEQLSDAEMQRMYESSFNASSVPAVRKAVFKDMLINASDQYALNMAARMKVKERKVL